MPCMLVLCTVRCACGLLCYILYFSDLYIRHAYTQRCYLLIVYFRFASVFVISPRFIHHTLCKLGSVLAPQHVPERPGMCGNLRSHGGPPLSKATLKVHSKEGVWCDTVRTVLLYVTVYDTSLPHRWE